MSHHTALFWIKDTTDPEEAVSQVDDFLNRYGDENNWYTILEARSSTGGHWIAEGGAGLDSFEDGQAFALSALAFEIAWNSPQGITFLGTGLTALQDAPQPTTLEETKSVIVQSMESQLADFKAGTGEEGFNGFLQIWNIKKLAQILLALRNSNRFPWVDDGYEGILYDHRCFQLCDGKELSEGGVIVAADVHT